MSESEIYSSHEALQHRIINLQFDLQRERERADRSEQILHTLTLKEVSRSIDSVASDRIRELHSLPRRTQHDIQTLYLALMEKKQARTEHLISKEHRRAQWREDDWDRFRITDRWAEKVLSAGDKVKQLGSYKFTSKQRGAEVPSSSDDVFASQLKRSAGKSSSTIHQSSHNTLDSDTDWMCKQEEAYGALVQQYSAKQKQAGDLYDEAVATRSSLANISSRMNAITKRYRVLTGASTDDGQPRLQRLRETLTKLQNRVLEATEILCCCSSMGNRVGPLQPGHRGWSSAQAWCAACRSKLDQLAKDQARAKDLRTALQRDEAEATSLRTAMHRILSDATSTLRSIPRRRYTLRTPCCCDTYAHGLEFRIRARPGGPGVVITGLRGGCHPARAGSALPLICVYVRSPSRQPPPDSSDVEKVGISEPLPAEDEVSGDDLSTVGSGGGTDSADSLRRWSILGMAEGLRLPSATLFDTDPGYGALPLKRPLSLGPGECRTLLVHVADPVLAIRRSRLPPQPHGDRVSVDTAGARNSGTTSGGPDQSGLQTSGMESAQAAAAAVKRGPDPSEWIEILPGRLVGQEPFEDFAETLAGLGAVASFVGAIDYFLQAPAVR